VLVAKEYLEQGTMLDETLVETRSVPKEYLQPKALMTVKDLADADGRQQFMTQVPVEKGEQVVTTKLFMLGADTGISAVIPTDRRAVTLIFDKEYISGVIKPGNKVDVVGVFEYYDKNGTRQESAVTVLQNVNILAVGKSILGQVKATMKSKKDVEKVGVESTENRVPVSFSVTPPEAEVLILASEKATMRLALRATGDDRIIPGRGTKLAEVVKDIGQEKRLSDTGAQGNTPMTEEYKKQMDENRKMQEKAAEILKKYKNPQQ
jgi:pilus assembly protein CpaB